jgi:membrane protein implicated in regulation of membrane protease activity
MVTKSKAGTVGKIARVAVASLLLAGCLLILTVLLVATFKLEWLSPLWGPKSLALFLAIYAVVSIPLAHRYFGR